MKICPTCQRTYADDNAFCPYDATPLQQAVAALLNGQVRDGRYQIEALIAETPSGRLYYARDLYLSRRVMFMAFISALSPEDVRAWHAIYKLQHPNIIRILDCTVSYVVMEYVAGETLDKELQQRRRFTPAEVVEILECVARALDYARSQDITCAFLMTADIVNMRAGDKPRETFLLMPSVFNRRFAGSVHDVSANRGELRPEVCAPYLAPELRKADISRETVERALVYSLGVIAYELLSGRKPDDIQTAGERAPGEANPLFASFAELAPGAPHAVVRLFERALDERLENRPANAGEFVAEFQGAFGIERIATGNPPMRSPGSTLNVVMGEASHGSRASEGVQIRAAESYSPNADASPSPSTDKPLYLDENVQFTVYQPERIAPARWYTLLAFAHLSKRREDAPPDEPEPLAEVKRIADRVLADQPAEYDALKQNSLHAVPRAGEITFVPEMAGCEFNPPRQTFSWQKSVHKVEFELRASQALEGSTARGRLTVFLGTLILADVPLVIRVESSASVSSQRESPKPVVPQSAAPYRKIFPSYSHKDRSVVEQIERHVHALGDKYLRDVTELRAGQDWQRWMRDAIREADVFQLFWSHNSMRSVYVREEWEYALSLGRPNFVRPTYWEFPLPESPTENLPPDELRRLHFQYLQASNVAQHPTHVEDDEDEATLAEARQERAAPVAAAAPSRAGREVSCGVCGSRNSDTHAFCLLCGAPLDTRAHTPAQAATSAAQQADNALDIFWQKRQRETGRFEPSPSQSMPVPMSPMPMSSLPAPAAPSGRPMLWIVLLICLLFLIALALGLYLLIYLL